MKRLSTSLLIFILALLAVPERMWAEDVSVKFLVRVADSDVAPALYLWYNNGSDVPLNGAWANTPTTTEKETIDGKTYYKYTITVPTATDLYLITKRSGNLSGNGNQSANSEAFKIASGTSVDYVLVEGSFNDTTKPTVNVVTVSSGTGHTFYLGCNANNWQKDESYLFTAGSSSTYTYTLAKANATGVTDGYFYVSILPYYNDKQWGTSSGGNAERICPANGDGTELTSTASGNNAMASKTFTSWKVKYVENATDYVFTFNHSNMSFSVVPTLVYNVKISAGEGGSVSPSGGQQIGSTPVKVTATPNTDYVFDKWIASDGVTVANASVAITTVKATKNGTLTANFKPTSTPAPTPTPILGNNFYLVGNLFDNETNINYDTRCFKFTDNGDNTYSLDIPATLTVKAQILSVNGTTEKVYGPSTGQNGFDVTSSTLSDNGQITDALSEGSKTPTCYWNFQDRTLASDGIYTITITLNSEGVPSSWTIKHDKTRRVAYYLSNSDGSTAQAAYAVKKADGSSDNKFFGSVFLSKGTGCYVISNMTKNADNNYHSLLKTTTKFYLQGNATGDSPVKGEDPNTKVYPVKYEGSEKGYKPFVFSSESDLQLLLEYNPSKGHDGTATQYGGIGGEVLRADYADASGVQLPQITGMKIVGPAVNNSWKLEDAVPMTYNDADNCWEAIINTSADAGGGFRFVANDTWKNSWRENGTDDIHKAKIPYDSSKAGHAATTADPNEVSYISTLTSEGSRDENYDIIFNRDHGTWRVRFYIETQSTEGGNKYNYVFKYTINGYKSVLRTYCSDKNEKPTDESIKIYGAYAFEGDENNKSGKIKLYEMNYIPANKGVILYSANVIDEATITDHTPSADETMYKKIPDNKYINYLVGTLENTPVNASEFDGNNVRTHRNFFFNYLKNSGYYKEGDTDYLGFFRIKSGSTCKANHAYLSLPTDILAWNGQTFGQVMDQYEITGEVASLKNGMRIIFSDGSDWVEDVPTSITTIKDKNRVFDNYYYTLQGVRVEKPLKGIYIHNGKKVVIK